MRRRGGVPPIVPRIAEICLVVLLAWLAMRLVYSFTPVDAALPDSVDRAGPAGPSLTADTSVFDRFDPFAARAVSSTAPTTVAAAETDLDIDLSGIWADGDGTGIAIIKMGNRGQKMYRVGDEIMNGVVLDRLEADRAIIRRAGRLESVSLSGRRAPGNGLMASNDMEMPSYAPSGDEPMWFPDGKLPPMPTSEELDAMAADSSASLENSSDDAASGSGSAGNGEEAIARLTAGVALQPVRRGGTITGYEVAPRGDYAIFRAYGFRPGDEIREINGQPVPATPQGFADLLQSLRGQSEIEVILDREGDGVTLTLNPGDL